MVAGVMTLALMVLPREEDGSGEEEPWLGGLATDHDKVYQAIGMIMAQLGVDADEAMALTAGPRLHAGPHRARGGARRGRAPGDAGRRLSPPRIVAWTYWVSP